VATIRASRKPAPPFPPSLRHHVSPRAGKVVNLTLSDCQRFSQGSGARRRLFERHYFFPWILALARPAWPRNMCLWHDYQRASSKPVPLFPPSLRLKETQARGLPCLCADGAGNIYSACSSVEWTTSPRRAEKAQHAKETHTLRRNAAWHHD
jgi:hypothetical protein